MNPQPLPLLDISAVDNRLIKAVERFTLEWNDFFSADKATLILQQRIKLLGRHMPHVVDYEKEYISFAKAYFFKNLYKNLVSFEYAKNAGLVPETSSIVDVGCGAGVSTIAWVLTGLLGKEDEVRLVDQSQSQLTLARRVLSFFSINTVFTFRMLFYSIVGELPGVAVFSYWVCEQDTLSILAKPEVFAAAVPQGVIVIDYEEQVTRFIQGTLETGSVHRWKFFVRPSEVVSDLLKEEEVEVNGCYYKPQRSR